MKKLIFLLFLSIPAFGQGALFQLPPPPLPNAVIYVCAVPANGNPCTNTVPLFSNQALTVSIPNPYTANSAGSASFWLAGGQYTIQIQAPYNIQYVTSLGGGSSGGSFPSGVGLAGATTSGTGFTSQSFIPPVDVRWFFTNPFPTYAQAQSQDFGAVLNSALLAATASGACVDVSGLNLLNAP